MQYIHVCHFQILNFVNEFMLVSGGLQHLNMQATDSVCTLSTESRTAAVAYKLAAEFVDKYTNLTLPSTQSSTQLSKTLVCND